MLVLEAAGGDIRIALQADAPALARVINDAFMVEAFFMIGERCRTSVDEIVELMEAGEFLVTGDTAGAMTGCVYLTCAGERAYFGMLSIDPPRQKRGAGRILRTPGLCRTGHIAVFPSPPRAPAVSFCRDDKDSHALRSRRASCTLKFLANRPL